MTLDSTLDSATTPTRGRAFTYSSGRGIVLMPYGDETWAILNPASQTVDTIRLDHVTWDTTTASDEEILVGLVDACQATFRRAMQHRSEVERLDATISEIREYAIDRHREGHYCRDGLNDALEHFGLDRYEPRYTACITITATAEINADTPHDAESRLRHLIDGVAYSGDTYTDDLDLSLTDVEITEIEAA